MHFILYLYYVLGILAIPFLWGLVLWRLKNGLEDQQRFKERFAITTVSRPQGAVVWFHAASVGETLSLIRLLKEFKGQNPNVSIVLTTVTVTSASIVNARLKDIVIHQYVPLDTVLYIKRFLRYWKPIKVFMVESELWPTMMHEVKLANIALVLLNARLSQRSFERWKLFSSIMTYLLSHFDEIYAQSQETAKRLCVFGVESTIKAVANLKFYSDPLYIDEILYKKVQGVLKSKKLMLVVSTHLGEDELIIPAFKQTKAHNQQAAHKNDDWLLIVAPRHMHRVDKIENIAQEANLTSLRLSNLKDKLDVDVLIIDSIGILGTFFKLASCVCVGGSFANHGGHNPIEPASFAKPVSFGPYMQNFKEITQLMVHGGAEQLASIAMLEEWMLRQMQLSQEARLSIGQQLYQVVETESLKCNTLVKQVLSLS